MFFIATLTGGANYPQDAGYCRPTAENSGKAIFHGFAESRKNKQTFLKEGRFEFFPHIFANVQAGAGIQFGDEAFTLISLEPQAVTVQFSLDDTCNSLEILARWHFGILRACFPKLFNGTPVYTGLNQLNH